jgi:hypothetical protein
MAESSLKAFQVGENDLIAHYSAEEARQLLIRNAGYDEDDILPSDVQECSESFLARPTKDEEGRPMEPWGDDFAKMTEPGWIGGWE